MSSNRKRCAISEQGCIGTRLITGLMSNTRKNDTNVVSTKARVGVIAAAVKKRDITRALFWYHLRKSCHQQGAALIPTRETVCMSRGCVVAAAGRGLYIPPVAPSGDQSDCGLIVPRTSSGEAFCSLRLPESSALADVKAGCP